MNIIFKGRHTDVLDRFRRHATAKLAKLGKLDSRAIRIDVEVSTERNPRQSRRRERVELTISSRGPAIRAEAAAEDRYAALDMAVTKLESRLRRAGDRRKCRHGAHCRSPRSIDLPAAETPPSGGSPARCPNCRRTQDEPRGAGGRRRGRRPRPRMMSSRSRWRETGRWWCGRSSTSPGRWPSTRPCSRWNWSAMTSSCSATPRTAAPSVVYRRRGYQYGVIRLVEEMAEDGRRPAAGRRRAQPGERAGRARPRSWPPGSVACVAGARRREFDHTAPRI